MENEQTKVVKIHDVHIDQDYVQWLGDIKARYRNSQIKAAVKVNAEQLRFNWQLGRDLVIRKAEERWGAGVVEQLSLDLQAEFPESKGFSTTNLWYMKQWYLFYAENRQKLQQLVGEIQATDNQINEKLSQVVREIQEPTLTINDGVPFPAFFSLVPWGHHLAIISKSKTLEEALFYIGKTISGNWSRNTLLNCIKADLFTPPAVQSPTLPKNYPIQAPGEGACEAGGVVVEMTALFPNEGTAIGSQLLL